MIVCVCHSVSHSAMMDTGEDTAVSRSWREHVDIVIDQTSEHAAQAEPSSIPGQVHSCERIDFLPCPSPRGWQSCIMFFLNKNGVKDRGRRGWCGCIMPEDDD